MRAKRQVSKEEQEKGRERKSRFAQEERTIEWEQKQIASGTWSWSLVVVSTEWWLRMTLLRRASTVQCATT